jgi:hypothetical protein
MTDRALLVGINKYPGAPLNGCINDINDMATYITSVCKFAPTAIKSLKDKAATTAAILSGLQWLVTGAKVGDRLFFHYSGHGAQVPTKTPAGEVDGLDEVICPVDFDWSDKRLIRDKQFRALFATIPTGVEFVWLSDSCHSGDLSKGMPKPHVTHRVMPLPDVSHPVHADLAKAREVLRTKKAAAPAAFNGALISGCKSSQTSEDAYINGRYNGACTYYLLQELRKNPKAKLTDVVIRMDAAVKAAGYDQVPGLEGSATVESRAFLSLT